MTASTSTEYELLLFLKIKGFATDEALGAMLGVSTEELPGLLESATGQGHATRREGRMTGTSLTAEGKQRFAELLTDRIGDAEHTSAITAVLEEFWPVNGDFKRICLRWQTREDGEPNDHEDESYDAAVLADLAAISDRVATVLSGAVAVEPRFARYRDRLQATLSRVQGGDRAAFLRPMSESFHDVWMELHEDLILSSGRTRGADDEG